jgi:hypothetical protein
MFGSGFSMPNPFGNFQMPQMPQMPQQQQQSAPAEDGMVIHSAHY